MLNFASSVLFIEAHGRCACQFGTDFYRPSIGFAFFLNSYKLMMTHVIPLFLNKARVMWTFVDINDINCEAGNIEVQQISPGVKRLQDLLSECPRLLGLWF